MSEELFVATVFLMVAILMTNLGEERRWDTRLEKRL